MDIKRLSLSLALIIALAHVSVAEPVYAAGRGGICDPKQFERRLEKFEKDAAVQQARIKRYEGKLEMLQDQCAKRAIAVCRLSEKELSTETRDRVLKMAAQIDDPKLREAFLNSFPPKDPEALKALERYLEHRMEYCSPPRYSSCSSERWQLIAEDYLASSGLHSQGQYSYLRRWDEDNVESRVPGLKKFIKEHKTDTHPLTANEAYVEELHDPHVEGEVVCVVSEQACKKTVNTANKALSDAIGNYRRDLFYDRLNELMAERGLAGPNSVYMDFKTDRFFANLDDLKQKNPKLYKELVEQASAEANAQLAHYIETQLPELRHLIKPDPRDWVKTATFSHPGFSPQMNETLGAFKVRMARSGVSMTDKEAIELFHQTGRKFNELAEQMEKSAHLVQTGVVETNGNFSIKTATVMRKLPAGDLESRASRLVDALKAKYGSDLSISTAEAKNLVTMWDTQDMLAIPLSNSDKMAAIDAAKAVLGGDGIAGGAIDAWAKGNAIRDHAQNLAATKGSPGYAEALFHALNEGDKNASVIIRSAPDIAHKAVDALPPKLKEVAGIREIFTSADDTLIPAERLAAAKADVRHEVLSHIAQNISESTKPVTITRNGVEQTYTVKSEILRFFGGANKTLAESAENFLKPIEERLGQSDALGHKWREERPNIGFIAWKNSDGTIELYVAGPHVDDRFREELKEAVQHTTRQQSDHVKVIFPDQKKPGTGAK